LPESSGFQRHFFLFFAFDRIDCLRRRGVLWARRLASPCRGVALRCGSSIRSLPPLGKLAQAPNGRIDITSQNPGNLLALALATACGAGLAPIAPGTFGSAVGVLLFVPLATLGPTAFAVATAALLGAGIWAADIAERVYQKKDDGRIVIDEVVGQLVTLSPLVFVAPDRQRSPLLLAAGFFAFRLFDIWKPGPVRHAERHFPGGTGVMLDDVVAGVFGSLVVAALLVLGVAAGSAP
jgi:phosphatidylglycerophosphatase A